VDKARYLTELEEFRNTASAKAFLNLFEACVDDLRKKNDNASTREVLRNQGAIRELNRLIKVLLPKRKLGEYDGAFNE
jgi:hypothetical protein